MPSVRHSIPLMLMVDMMLELGEFQLNWNPQRLLELEPATSAKFASCTFSALTVSFPGSHPEVLCSLFLYYRKESGRDAAFTSRGPTPIKGNRGECGVCGLVMRTTYRRCDVRQRELCTDLYLAGSLVKDGRVPVHGNGDCELLWMNPCFMCICMLSAWQ